MACRGECRPVLDRADARSMRIDRCRVVNCDEGRTADRPVVEVHSRPAVRSHRCGRWATDVSSWASNGVAGRRAAKSIAACVIPNSGSATTVTVEMSMYGRSCPVSSCDGLERSCFPRNFQDWSYKQDGWHSPKDQGGMAVLPCVADRLELCRWLQCERRYRHNDYVCDCGYGRVHRIASGELRHQLTTSRSPCSPLRQPRRARGTGGVDVGNAVNRTTASARVPVATGRGRPEFSALIARLLACESDDVEVAIDGGQRPVAFDGLPLTSGQTVSVRYRKPLRVNLLGPALA